MGHKVSTGRCAAFLGIWAGLFALGLCLTRTIHCRSGAFSVVYDTGEHQAVFYFTYRFLSKLNYTVKPDNLFFGHRAGMGDQLTIGRVLAS